LKLRQDKYDDALNVLSHAIKTRPQDPRLQNMLGLALSHSGQRGPAETAFRKALQSDPNFADAHANLATIYITQKPPSTELARWHYQRAKAAGSPRNPDMEKLLEETPATAKAN
jgi:Flp pilus assembly protein TadD